MKKTRTPKRMHRCECPQCQQHPYSHLAHIHRAINRVLASLDERRRRQCAGLLARQYGRGGIHLVHLISGLSCPTIRRGQQELGTAQRTDRVRAPGGGRWPVEKKQPTLLTRLEQALEDETAGDPMRGLKWTRKTLRRLAADLSGPEGSVGHETMRRLLDRLEYTLRANRKRVSRPSDGAGARDQQMRHIARVRHAYERAGIPVISVDGKKKELIGNFKNPGRTYRRTPRDVLATDFPEDALGKAIPYGIYDVAHNRGFVVVGTSHETAAFAVNAIRRWWRQEGRRWYPHATTLLLLADAGGASHYRSDLWKWEVQRLADATGLTIRVMHYPTSASKWNLIEHRLFSSISANWAGVPLTSYETVLKYIRTTTTEQGLRCRACLDTRVYATGRKLSRAQKATLHVVADRVVPKWNYTLKPHASHTSSR